MINRNFPTNCIRKNRFSNKQKRYCLKFLAIFVQAGRIKLLPKAIFYVLLLSLLLNFTYTKSTKQIVN